MSREGNTEHTGGRRGKEKSMFPGNGIQDWWMKIAALTERRTRFLLSQTGRRDKEGEFSDALVGRVPPGVSAFSVK